ncbi:MAG: methyltransferase domain-containing protein [Gemmatimonadales bacterium]
MSVDSWLLSILSCPFDSSGFHQRGDRLECRQGHVFPVVEGVPVLLRHDADATHPSIAKTLSEVRDDRTHAPRISAAADGIDPVVQIVIAATCGRLYSRLVGKLTRYPIPRARLPRGDGKTLLDIGCNWGRWTFSAVRNGYRAVGIDPDLGPVLAAKRIAAQLGLVAHFVVGDARSLPFAPNIFDTVFSYSVIQHFSKSDARIAFVETGRVLTDGGSAMIQMPNAYGARNIFHQLTHRSPQDFDVRYWTPRELLAAFDSLIGPGTISVDGFFGLGIQPDDIDLLPFQYRLVVKSSEILRSASDHIPGLRHLADSLYVTARKRA